MRKVTRISSLAWTLFIAFCGRSARFLFSLTNPCVTNFMIICGKTYVLSYTTTRGASLLTVIWENILMRGLSAKDMIFCSSQCWFFIERTLENKVYIFSNWIFIILYVCRIDIWHSVCRSYTIKPIKTEVPKDGYLSKTDTFTCPGRTWVSFS